MDSGGSYHMTYKRDYLFDFEEYDSGNVLLGNGRECRVWGTEGFTVKMQPGKIKVIRGSLVVLSGTRRANCVYILDGQTVTRKSLKGRKQLGEYHIGWMDGRSRWGALDLVAKCTLPTEGIRSIISSVSISPEGFPPSILLLVVMVVIVAVILVVVVAIVGVAIVVMIIGVVVEITIIGVVVVVSGVSSIIKLSFVIIGFLHKIMLYYLLHQHLSYGNGFLQSLRF
ncbi:hypothetical protein Tco_1281721 [Tanacetum coccineum]